MPVRCGREKLTVCKIEKVEAYNGYVPFMITCRNTCVRFPERCCRRICTKLQPQLQVLGGSQGRDRGGGGGGGRNRGERAAIAFPFCILSTHGFSLFRRHVAFAFDRKEDLRLRFKPVLIEQTALPLFGSWVCALHASSPHPGFVTFTVPEAAT